MAENTTFDYLNGDASGFEQITNDTVAFPFIRIIQSISPICKKGRPEYVEGAEEGKLYNTITKRIIDVPARIVVGRFDRYFLEWKPERKGLAGHHTVENVDNLIAKGRIVADGPNFRDPATGNIFQETYAYYIVFPDYIEDGVCLLCLSSTQLKEAKRLNRMLTTTYIPGTSRRAMPYHMVWKLDTPIQSNDKGDWAGIKFSFDSFVTPQILGVVNEERKALSAVSSEQVDYKALEASELDSNAYEATASDAAPF